MRVRAIDAFRGIAIVLMVFFSLTIRLSGSLPDVLRHNVAWSLHAGDFILPMFIFASGMSLVFFAKKREKKGRTAYVLDVAERLGKLVLVWALISLFSSGEWFGMDELMLIAILFVLGLALAGFGELALGALTMAICLAYVALLHLGMLPDFTAHYLGGYAAAVFYLPVMLAGVIAGKRVERGTGNWKRQTEELLLPALVAAIILLLLVPPWKMDASPSFMALSVSLSLLVFSFLSRVPERGGAVAGSLDSELVYLGTRPLRYWALMFVVLIIPMTFYAAFTGGEFPLGLGWVEAVLCSVLCVPLLWLVSKALDRAGWAAF